MEFLFHIYIIELLFHLSHTLHGVQSRPRVEAVLKFRNVSISKLFYRKCTHTTELILVYVYQCILLYRMAVELSRYAIRFDNPNPRVN